MVRSGNGSNNDTFVRITNKDIYEGLQKIHEELLSFKTQNVAEHNAIIQRQDRTNGKVRLNRWIATTALSLVVAVLVSIAQRLFG